VFALPGLGLYHASKWGLEGLTSSLAMEVRSFGIKVTLIEPRRLRSWEEFRPVAPRPVR
jgi:NAD(P)-dependent dehydrogenase (short-subunit alcohol dehydrogenase family)